MLWLLRQMGVEAAGYDRWRLALGGSPAAAEFRLLLAALVAALVLSAWQLRGGQRPARRAALLALRALALALVAALFLEPTLHLLKTVPVRSQVVVGIDRTPSMSIPDEAGGTARAEQVAKALAQEAPWAALEQGHDVRYVFFSGRGEEHEHAEVPRAAAAGGYQTRGNETDLGAALADLSKLSREKATAGVVLITDGADLGPLGELRKDPGGLAAYLKRNDLLPSAPLSTVRVGGASPFPDLSVREVVADEYGFIRNQVQVKAQIAAQGLGARSVPVAVKLGGEVVAARTAELSEKGGVVEVELGFSPTRVGEFVYTVEVPVLSGERIAENNHREFKIKIIRDKVRVLQVVGRPSWDEQFLRRTLKQDPNIDLVSFMILRELTANPFRDDELSLIPFPTDEIFDKKLHTFDLVIFQNFQYVPRYGILPRHLSNVRDFVVRDGGGFVMLGGDQSFAAGYYLGTPIEEILPVSLQFAGSLFDAGKAVAFERFAPQLPAGVRLHPIMRLDFDPLRSEQMWKQLPPLDGVNRTGDLVPGAVALLTHPSLKTPTGKPAPVVAALGVGKGRALAIATDTSWYWSFLPVDGGGTNQAYLSFWREAIRWLTRDPALKQVNITTDRPRYRPGEEVRMEASVLDPSYAPVSDAAVAMSLKSLAGEPICSGPGRPVGEGRYEMKCRAQGTGYLEAHAEASKVAPAAAAGGAAASAPLGGDSAFVEVVALGREFERTDPDAELLSLLADLGGGKALSIEDGKLSGDPAIIEERSYRILGSREMSLWDTPPALLLLAGLAICEWWLRRRWGYA